MPNRNGVRFDDIAGWIKEGCQRGVVITIRWHMENPATHTDARGTTRAVYRIISGGDLHEADKAELDTVAGFLKK